MIVKIPMNIRDFYRKRRVLVTGNTGFKGAWLSAWLESLGVETLGVSMDVPTEPSAFRLLGGPARFPTRMVDIRDGEALAAVFAEFKPDVVFHMAAQSLVRRSYQDPVNTWSTNVMGTVQVLDCVRKTESVRGCAVISSDKCYENLETGAAYRETDRLGGKDPYSASKAGTELVFHSMYESYFAQGARHAQTALLSFRAGNVIGGADWAADRLVPDGMRAMRAGQPLVVRQPQATRPWQHVLEPLGGYMTALARGVSDLDGANRWTGESFNFGPTPKNTRTVHQLLEGLATQMSGFRWETPPQPKDAFREAGTLSVSSEKATEWMKWAPTLNFDETIAWTARGYCPDDQFESVATAQIAEFQKRADQAGWTQW